MFTKFIDRFTVYFSEPVSVTSARRFLCHEARESAEAVRNGIGMSYRGLGKKQTEDRLYNYSEDYLPTLYLIQHCRAALESLNANGREIVFADALGHEYEVIFLKHDRKSVSAVVRQR